MRIAISAIACLSLCACGHLNWRPTMQADPAETGIEGLAYINTLWDAYEVDPDSPRLEGQPNGTRLCTFTIPQFQQRDNDSYYRYYGKHKNTEDRVQCLKFKPSPTTDDIKTYLHAGFALSDLYCSIFFRRVSFHQQTRNFARNDVNDAGAAISAILGLAKVASPWVGGVGAGFGLADSVFRTYDMNFVVSADLPSLLLLVNATQDKFAADTFAKLPDNYPDASKAISRHANFCSFLGMKTLVNSSVSTTTEVKKADPSTSTATAAAAAATTVKSAEELKVDSATTTLAQAEKAVIDAEAAVDKPGADLIKTSQAVVVADTARSKAKIDLAVAKAQLLAANAVKAKSDADKEVTKTTAIQAAATAAAASSPAKAPTN